MKKFSIFTIVCFMAVLVFASCAEDDEATTELGWTNKSNAAINDIAWGNEDKEEDQVWTKEVTGYAVEEDTEQKKVSVLEGSAGCTIDIGGGDFVAADSVELGTQAQSSLVLDEGESLRYDISATAKKK